MSSSENTQNPTRASFIMPATGTADGQEHVMSQAANDLQARATGHSAPRGHPGSVPGYYLAAFDAEDQAKITASNDTPSQHQDREDGIGTLAGLAGLETVNEQVAARIAVLQAERARRQAGIEVRRSAWKNLVFTGGPGTGKSRVAAAVARIYRELGLLSYGDVIEIAAADLVGATPPETGTLIVEATTRAGGDLLMISDAHAWHRLPDRGQHVLRCLYRELSRARDDRDGELAVILAGRAAPSSTCCAPARPWPPASPQ